MLEHIFCYTRYNMRYNKVTKFAGKNRTLNRVTKVAQNKVTTIAKCMHTLKRAKKLLICMLELIYLIPMLKLIFCYAYVRTL
jgi:hypothetical protein